MTEQTPVKKCKKCGKQLPATELFFYANLKLPGGLAHTCRGCHCDWNADYFQTVILHAKLKQRGYKQCSRCANVYPATAEYFRLDKRRNGIGAECIQCNRLHYHQNREQYAERFKRYRQENQDRFIAYRERNREKFRQYDRERYLLVRDRKREYDKKRYNPDYLRDYRRRSAGKFRARDTAYQQRYRQQNPQAHRAANNRRRARKLLLPDNFSTQDWQHALTYFAGCCAVCGNQADKNLTIAADHWIPLTHPNCPGTIPTNIIPLCHGNGGCNNRKQNKDAEVWLYQQFGKDKADEIMRRIQSYFGTLT